MSGLHRVSNSEKTPKGSHAQDFQGSRICGDSCADVTHEDCKGRVYYIETISVRSNSEDSQGIKQRKTTKARGAIEDPKYIMRARARL